MEHINDSELERQVARMLRAADKVEGAEAMERERQAIAERQRYALVDDSERSGSLEAAVHAADVQRQPRDEQELRSFLERNPEQATDIGAYNRLAQRFFTVEPSAIHRAISAARNRAGRSR